MTAAAVILYVVAALAELGGVLLIARQGRRARRKLSTFLDLNPDGNENGSWDQLGRLNPMVAGMLAHQAEWQVAVSLVVIGVLAGLGGNLLSVLS